MAETIDKSQAQDLRYGEVLFEYHQGHAFEALSLLNVAKEKGGIRNHGDHPSLVEGGLMLAYGMTREAKATFQEVLEDQVSAEDRNKAWFYLGKVFYLEQDKRAAIDALNKVDAQLLDETNPQLFNEWRYLKNQISLGDGGNVEMDLESSLWSYYIAYNQSVLKFASDPEAAIAALLNSTQLLELNRLSIERSERANGVIGLSHNPAMGGLGYRSEATELIARSYLTLGQWQLQLQNYEEAMNFFGKIQFDSVFSDQSLFLYSVAASHLEKYGLALGALNKLKSRESFTPWLQQIPYALGYLYEQMQDLSLALQAYQSAGDLYENRLAQLAQQRDTLTEQQILDALRFDQRALEKGSSPAAKRVSLGVDSILNDAYGHIRVQPKDFAFAHLLSLESFQLGLRDLHELYKLKHSLVRWDQQLGSFDIMLDTRASQRALRVEETQLALASQNADQWQALQKSYGEQIQRALDDEDAEFFMDEQQRDLKQTIDQVYRNLETLPNDEDKKAYQQKIDRMSAYFQWWINDRYGVNRWEAEKQLKGLNMAMEEFNARRAVLESELVSDQRHQAFQTRIHDGQARLTALNEGVDQALEQARQHLIGLVKAEIERQSEETAQYLLVSRKAEARLADALYQQGEAK